MTRQITPFAVRTLRYRPAPDYRDRMDAALAAIDSQMRSTIAGMPGQGITMTLEAPQGLAETWKLDAAVEKIDAMLRAVKLI